MTDTRPPEETAGTAGTAGTAEPLTVEMLVEEVSIDDMCGVY